MHFLLLFTCTPYTSSITFLVRHIFKINSSVYCSSANSFLNTYTFLWNTLWTEWKNVYHCSSTPRKILGITRHILCLKLWLLCSVLVCTTSLLHILKYFSLPGLQSFLPFREKRDVVPAQKQIAITTQRTAARNCYRASPNYRWALVAVLVIQRR